MTQGLSPRAAVLLPLGVFIVGSGALVISPVLPDIAAGFEVSPAAAGLAVSVYGLALAMSAPVVGLYADRWPRRRLIALGLGLFAVALIFTASAPNLLFLALAQAAAGVGAGLYLPAAYAYVGDAAALAERGRAMGRVMSGWAFAMILGVPLGGLLGAWLGWRGLFLTLSVLGAMAALSLIGLPSVRDPDAVKRSPLAVLTDLRGSLNAGVVLAVNFLNMGAFYGVYTYLGTYLRELHGWSSAAAGGLVLFYGLGLLVSTFSGSLLDRWGKAQVVVRAALVLAVVLASLPWAGLSGVSLAAAALCWGLAQGSFLTSLASLAAEVSDRARGAMMALLSATTYLGVMVGAAAGGWFFASFGYIALALICGAANLIGAALFAQRYQRRPVVETPA